MSRTIAAQSALLPAVVVAARLQAQSKLKSRAVTEFCCHAWRPFYRQRLYERTWKWTLRAPRAVHDVGGGSGRGDDWQEGAGRKEPGGGGQQTLQDLCNVIESSFFEVMRGRIQARRQGWDNGKLSQLGE